MAATIPADLIPYDSGIDNASADCGNSKSYYGDEISPSSNNYTTPSARSDSPLCRLPSWKAKLIPPRGPVVKWLTWTIVVFLVFGVVWSVAPEVMKPGESWFGLVVTLILCFVAEVLIVKIPTPRGFPPPPPLLASLLMGLTLANLPEPLKVASYIDPEKSRTLRELALTIILTRAGLEIDPAAMAKVKWAVVRLAFLPCIGETIVFGILAHFLLKFDFEWSFMTGFMLAAVSPAVVIPSLIILQNVGLGVTKGIPSLIMAASGIDDVLAIAGFSVLLGIAIPAGLEEDVLEDGQHVAVNANTTSTTYDEMSTVMLASHNIGKELAGAVIEVVIGITAGLLLGLFISYIPHRGMPYKTFCRAFLLLSIGIFFVFGTEIWGIPGSGTLCALIMSFVAAFHWGEESAALEKIWHYMWFLFQPVLFGLTGTLVDVKLMDSTTVGLGLALLACSMAGRLAVSTSVTFGLGLNLKERLFISISWIPKGTVQAALGSAALDLVTKLNRPEEEIHWSEQILVLAVLDTLVTAPIGAFGISYFGPKLLSAGPGSSMDPEVNKAYQEDEGEESDDKSREESDIAQYSKTPRDSYLPGLCNASTRNEIKEGQSNELATSGASIL